MTAKLTIPVGYVEDFRTAITRELKQDGDRLRVAQADVADGRFLVEDRENAARLLRADLELFEQFDNLTEADAPFELWGPGDLVDDVLQEMVRMLSKRLRGLVVYAPVDMDAVLDVAARMRWAAEEARRIEPARDPAAAV